MCPFNFGKQILRKLIYIFRAAETVEATSAGMMEASTDRYIFSNLIIQSSIFRVGSEAECLVATSVVDKTEVG